MTRNVGDTRVGRQAGRHCCCCCCSAQCIIHGMTGSRMADGGRGCRIAVCKNWGGGGLGVVDCGVIYLFIYFFEEGAIPTISSESTVTPKKKPAPQTKAPLWAKLQLWPRPRILIIPSLSHHNHFLNNSCRRKKTRREAGKCIRVKSCRNSLRRVPDLGHACDTWCFDMRDACNYTPNRLK